MVYDGWVREERESGECSLLACEPKVGKLKDGILVNEDKSSGIQARGSAESGNKQNELESWDVLCSPCF